MPHLKDLAETLTPGNPGSTSVSSHIRYLLSHGPVVVFALNLERVPFYLSPNMERILGYPMEKLYDGPFRRELLHPEDRAPVEAAYASLGTEEQAQIDCRMRRADGKYLHLRSHITVERDETGGPLRMVGFFLDQTEQVEQKLHLEEQQQQMVEVNKSLEQFVHAASHDLREPLSGATGMVELVRTRFGHQLEDRAYEFLEQAENCCKAMGQKLDDLLEFSRAGKGTLTGNFPLGSSIEEAQKCLAGVIQRTGAIIRYGNLPVVRGDRGSIAQVFQNLFSNSIKYKSRDTHPIIDIDIQPYPEDPSRWCVSVKDNGLGFDMRYADRIFKLFQRLYTVDQYPGTGIGLALVKRILEKHGEKIWVKSADGAGSTFFFTISKSTT